MTYNPRKAAQIIAFFALKTGGNAINVLKAMKLVYIADREHIGRYGFPILDERRVSMRHGPVNSCTYNYIKGEVPPQHDGGWGEFVKDRAEHNVGLVSEGMTIDSLDELSEAEIDTLEAVWKTFGQMDQWRLVDFTHDTKNIPEWTDPQDQGSRTITLEDILAATNVPSHEDHAAEIESIGKATGFLKGL